MHNADHDNGATSWPPFVPTRDGGMSSPMSDRKRFILWQATGVLIDDTEFDNNADGCWDRMWFPPRTHQLSANWWAKMKLACQRLEEAFRTGKDLHTRTFAEAVALATVLRSDGLVDIADSTVNGDIPEFDALPSSAVDDLDFQNVLPDMAGDRDVELLFPNIFEVGERNEVTNATYALPQDALAGLFGDPERWFAPGNEAMPEA